MFGISQHRYINSLIIKHKNEDDKTNRNREFVIKQINLIIPKVVKFFCEWCKYNKTNGLIETIINDEKPYISDRNEFIMEFNIRSIGNAINIRSIGNAFDLYYYTDQSAYIFYHIFNVIPNRILGVDIITDKLIEKWSDEIISLLDIEKLYTFRMVILIDYGKMIARTYISD
jgi:hypothetical protein